MELQKFKGEGFKSALRLSLGLEILKYIQTENKDDWECTGEMKTRLVSLGICTQTEKITGEDLRTIYASIK